MDNNVKSNTNFWTEISKYKIYVPYYQRDYAQGRCDGGRIDNIRKVFVEELYQAITDPKGEEICHLGLVFGSYDEDNKTFIAVDGQQRLTTIFLLHWFVAWREGKLSNYEKSLKNFSWDTRSYSSQFVALLFNIKPFDIKLSNNVIKAIKTHYNYFSIWENDPTVKGMLTMVEEIETQYPNEDGLCAKLFSNDCNIRYDILRLEKNSDGRTYLKMNSRGRSLTTFELFKSKFIDNYSSFATKFDTDWLIFMLAMSKNENDDFADPDVSYMNFINEYTYLILKSKDNKDSDTYKDFIEAKLKDNQIDVPFISFKEYKPAFDKNVDCFSNFFNWIIDNYEKIKRVDEELGFKPDKKEWEFFLDKIIKSHKPNFTHRAKFLSLFKYANLTKFDVLNEKLYRKWNRVFRNLIENSDIDAAKFGDICETVNRINNSDIYVYLSCDEELDTFDKGQVKEEIAKAKQILNGGNEWESKIIEAEKYAFFKGAIRFLFQDAEGNVTDESWKGFDTKLENARKYFKPEKDAKNCLKDEYNNANLLKSLLSRFENENFWSVLNWSHRTFNNKAETWRYYLLNSNIVNPIHQLLMGEIAILIREPSEEDFAQNTLYQLSNTMLLDFVMKRIPDSWIRDYHFHKAIFPSGTGVFLNASDRDNILDSFALDVETKVPDTKFLYGSDINFKYEGHNFQWYRTDFVYLMKNDARQFKNENATEETEKYYCRDVRNIKGVDEFKSILKEIVEDSQEKANSTPSDINIEQ